MLCAFFAIAAGTLGLQAQQNITSITTLTVSGSSYVNTGVTPIGGGASISVTYTGTERVLQTLTASSGTYAPAFNGVAYARRNNGSAVSPVFSNTNANQTSAWNIFSGSTAGNRTVQGEYHGTMESLLTNSDFNTGTENLFVNIGSNSDPSSNIERMDFMFGGTSGLTASSGQAFAVFERGRPGGNNGGFQVALVTAVDGAGVPTAYDDTVILVPTNSYGNPPVTPSSSYDIYRNNTAGGTDLDVLGNAAISNQGVGGVLITLASFGLSPGTTYYGYSVFALDVTYGGNTANLVNWNNSSFFPQNSSLSGNDVDMVASGASVFVIVPEPSVVALMMGSVATLFLSRRKRVNPLK